MLWRCVGECGDGVTLVSLLARAVATVSVGHFCGAAGRTVHIRVTRQQFQQLMYLRTQETTLQAGVTGQRCKMVCSDLVEFIVISVLYTRPNG